MRPENGWGARERVIERRVLYALFERGNGRVGLRVSCHDGRPGVDRYFVEDGGRNGR